MAHVVLELFMIRGQGVGYWGGQAYVGIVQKPMFRNL